MTTKPQQSGFKVVPFCGEFYEQPPQQESPPPQNNSFAFLFFVAACLIAAGVALGSTINYHSGEQVQIRELQQQSQQLEKIKKEACE